jgi:hypothetical protein
MLSVAQYIAARKVYTAKMQVIAKNNLKGSILPFAIHLLDQGQW